MAAPTHDDLLLLVRERQGSYSWTDMDKDRADLVLGIITNLVRSYTRGVGFVDGVPNDELGAVILVASARLWGNTRQVRSSEVKGPQSLALSSYFEGWSLSELGVLHRYRVTAQ